MRKQRFNLLVRTIHWWEANVLNRPWLLIILSVLLCALTGNYALHNLTINTNTADMISIQLPFQQNRIRLESAFPQDVSTVLLMVEGPNPEQTAEAVKRIGEGLRADRGNIRSVYIPDEGDFFTRNGMLYLSMKELEDLSTQLANAQPFIGRLSQDNSLDGPPGILGQALDAADQDIAINLKPVLGKVREAMNAVLAETPFQVSWQQLMLSEQTGLGITKRFIIVTPILNFSEFLPAEKTIGAINAVVDRSVGQGLNGVRVRMTGEVVLEHEEMADHRQGTSRPALPRCCWSASPCGSPIRSFKLMFATFISLTMGLILFAGLRRGCAVGHLNLISIAFAVLFIGMGDAYSSHFCLRYRELMLRGLPSATSPADTLTVDRRLPDPVHDDCRDRPVRIHPDQLHRA